MLGSTTVRTLATALLCGCLAPSAIAADAIEPPPDTSDWTFVASAYLWAAGLDGNVGVFGLPAQDVDLSFNDILGDLSFAFMGLAEARKGRFSVAADVVYVKLDDRVNTPFGVVADSIDIGVKTFMGTAVAGYSVYDSGTANFDLVAGARLWSVDNDFDLNSAIPLPQTSFNDGDTWVDPLVGAKFKADLGTDFYVSGWGLVGGFGVSSDFMWDVLGGAGYRFTDSFSVFGGYRATGVDYSNGGFVYDVVQHGPMFAGVFRF